MPKLHERIQVSPRQPWPYACPECLASCLARHGTAQSPGLRLDSATRTRRPVGRFCAPACTPPGDHPVGVDCPTPPAGLNTKLPPYCMFMNNGASKNSVCGLLCTVSARKGLPSLPFAITRGQVM